MSQGNWGGGGGGPGGWGGGPPGGGGYGPPGGAPPGGGGYGPPGGAPPGGGGYGPPPGGAPPGGYGPPGGGAPPGGYGPPGGAPPGGFGGPPGGAPPGGYGPPGGAPPGGGGYGPPPGGFGGPPPGGGYGPPPDAGGFGPPPGMMGGGGGQRAQFLGEGGKLLVTFLIWGLAPAFAGAIFFGIMNAVGMAVDSNRRGEPGPIAIVMMLIGALVYYGVVIVGNILFQNKSFEFRAENTTLDGQRCRYVGTAGGLFKTMFVNMILTSITFGIYAPWAVCKMWSFVQENTEVNGQRGRLTFHGDGGTLLGKWIVGMILMMCTAGIYGAWFANDIFAFYWENTKLDGRGFSFRKDPGGFLGTMILNAVLSYCTFGIYAPWAMCNIWKWEHERVS